MRGRRARGGIGVDMWTAASPYIMSADDVVVTAPKVDQSITFAPLIDRTYGDAPVNLSASAASGLPVTLTVVSGPASLVGNVLREDRSGPTSAAQTVLD